MINMTKKRKIIIISCISVLVIILGIMTGVYINRKDNKKGNVPNTSMTENKKNKDIENMTETQKKIAGIDDEISKQKEKEEKTYSRQYKEYLKLPEEEKEKLEVIPRKENVPFEKLEEIKENLYEDEQKKENNNEETIPEKFNLADKINIKVENQGSYGLCWDFASIKPLETYLALNNLGDYDFSELHVDYIESNLLYGERELHQGGNFDMFKNYLIESGVVLESDVPYNMVYTEEEYNKLNEIPKAIEVTETVDFPSIYKGENSNCTDEEIKNFRETVKKHIMKNGGLYTCIVGTGEKNAYVSPDESKWPNHAVTIVGWDDNYSRDNFTSDNGKKPEKDGAYIALNSWGNFWNDGGYYYISYEDRDVEQDLSGIVSTSFDNAYKIKSIKDKFVRNYLEENYGHQFKDYNGEKYITKNAISNIHSMDLSNKNISSIEGFEIFNDLYWIDLSNNKITDISSLSEMKTLTEIDLSNNKVKDITPLESIKELRALNLSGNNIKDVSCLAKEDEQNDGIVELNLSGNRNVKGYEKLNSLTNLNLTNCDITNTNNLSNLYNLSILTIPDNNLSNIEGLPTNLNDLNISNCNFDNLDKLADYTQLTTLNVSHNKITTLEDLPNFKCLTYLDVSGNPIQNWDKLKNIGIEFNIFEENEEFEENEYERIREGRSIWLEANDCNIEDISIFNNLKLNTLSLKNNNIKDISKFENENIYFIDLSNNSGIKGLQSLNKMNDIILDDCNISDIEEISKLESVENLSLKNNSLSDITGLSNLPNIWTLSLEGNTNISGTLSSERLFSLNLKKCNLDNSLDISKIPNLLYLNISENQGITDISKIVKQSSSEHLTLEISEIDFDELEKIIQETDKSYLRISQINVNCELVDKNQIDFSKNKTLKRALMKNIANGSIYMDNGYLNKNGYSITVKDTGRDNIKLKLLNFSRDFYGEELQIIYKPDAGKTTSTNTIQNTTKNNNITNEHNTIRNNTKNETNTSSNNENTEQNNVVNNTIQEGNVANENSSLENTNSNLSQDNNMLENTNSSTNENNDVLENTNSNKSGGNTIENTTINGNQVTNK